MDEPVLFKNEGDVQGEQYGISAGTVGDNSTVNQSITKSTSYSLSMSSTENNDSHDSYTSNDSHDSYSETHSDSHDISNVWNSYRSESHVSNSVSNTYNRDSHDTYSTQNSHTYYDDHSVRNTNISTTSTGQAVTVGVFFGNGQALVLVLAALAAAGIAVYVFIDTLILASAVVSAIGLTSVIAHDLLKGQNKKQLRREHTFAILEQREHELRLAEVSRPLHITVNAKEDLYSVLPAVRPNMIEDKGKVIRHIEFDKTNDKEYAYIKRNKEKQQWQSEIKQ